TTVIGPEGERIEIQIRTEEMHRLAEHGVASHWLYKERNHSVDVKDAPQFEWLREIVNRQGEEADSKEFMHSLRMDLFKDEVYVFTPAGDVKELPEGATPLDFAFLIHTQVGSRCVGAKVNGKLIPLNSALKSGDMVEIITDKNRHPSRDWLKIVKTAKARSRIQQYLRTEERGAAVGLGREMLEKEGRRMGINLSKAEKDGHLITLVNQLAAGSVDELMASVGYARFTSKQVLRRLQSIIAPPETTDTLDSVDSALPRKKDMSPPPSSGATGITVRGVDDMLVRFARCCSPVPGDSIVGFVSRGRGVIVHTASCANILDLEPDRLVSVQWDGHENQPFPVRIHLISHNEKGSLADIALVLRDEDVNIETCHLQSQLDGRCETDMLVHVRDVAHLYHVIDKLRHLPSVMEVLRRTSEEE
ncbi:MAG: TGS domain-containing protein, partial [Bilophila sp.]